jgi:hypothetical protein
MSLKTFPTDPWTIACNRYQEDLSEEEKSVFNQASPENLLYSASALQKRHMMDSKTRFATKKMKPFVDAIEEHGKALDVLSNLYPMFLAPIWGGLRVLLQIAREYEKYFDKVVEMFGLIGNILPRFQGFEELFSDHRRLVHALSVVYLDIMTFCMDVKAVFRKISSGRSSEFFTKALSR